MVSVPHLVQYQGSKRNLAQRILRFCPSSVPRLVEPFAGTAAMSVAAAMQRRSGQFWLNDLNSPLIELLKLVIYHPQELADSYADLWSKQEFDSMSHYFGVRRQFNESQDPKLFLYLLARCVKGAVRYNSQGEFNQSPDKRRRGTRPETMRKNIEGVSRLLRGHCELTAWDYREVLEGVSPGDLLYLDPPYQGVCGRGDSRYLSGIEFHEFVLALERLNQRGIAFILSYDGQRGETRFGQALPKSLGLQHITLTAGRSSQATLLGRDEVTIESLYLSPSLCKQHPIDIPNETREPRQLTLW
jgi:DNA adenine methylase